MLNIANHSLIEYIAQCRKICGNDFAPTTLKSYHHIINNRAFQNKLNLKIDILNHPIFTNDKTGIMAVIDNEIRRLQVIGRVTCSQNIISRDDILKLYDSK